MVSLITSILNFALMGVYVSLLFNLNAGDKTNDALQTHTNTNGKKGKKGKLTLTLLSLNIK